MQGLLELAGVYLRRGWLTMAGDEWAAACQEHELFRPRDGDTFQRQGETEQRRPKNAVHDDPLGVRRPE